MNQNRYQYTQYQLYWTLLTKTLNLHKYSAKNTTKEKNMRPIWMLFQLIY